MKSKFMKSSRAESKFAAIFLWHLLALLAILPTVATNVSAQDDKMPLLRPTVRTAARYDLSPPLRSIKPILTNNEKEKGADDPGKGPIGDTRHDPDPVVQTTTGDGIFNNRDIPSLGVSFNGLSNNSGVNPPDPVGDIGPNHYVQMVNSRFAIYSRTGALLFGPANINTLFSGFGGACQTQNAGDPVVLYDQLADRWILSQFTATAAAGVFFNCVAISTGSDPTGTYYRYAFSTGANFPDYPKYGVWSDAYFISTREFVGSGGPFAGIGAYALNKAQMLAGNPNPQVISFVLPPSPSYRTGDGLLPADLDGTTLPPANSPYYFVGSMDLGGPYGAPADALNLFKFNVDWVTPGNSTFAFSNQIPVAAFDSIFPCTPSARACIPQPASATTQKLDILSYRQRPTFRLAYRNFGTHESLVTSMSVEATTGIAGMRWWEIRSPSSNPVIYQEGTYAPSDDVHRWMGSVAMDANGNMGMGYSVSSALNVFPGIRYTGRLATDPLGTMPQGEGVMVEGGGAQTTTNNRWGDYSSMNIDPTDDCTFWYTTEYYSATSSANWTTRISSFKFPTCSASPVAAANISGRVTTVSGRGIPFARLTLTGGNLTSPLYAQTNAFGYYRFANLPSGVSYTVTASAKKYTFANASQSVTLNNNVDNINFIANQ